MTVLPCAIYTRKSSEEGLEQGFNSLDAQREACQAFILSQKALGWKVGGCYDDGGFSGGNVERPGLQRLLADIAAKRVRVVVVYKVDRLTRSLADFAKLVELFDAQGVSFVSVTQQFNTTSSMGRLTLNVLLSFAQFEREVTGERIRDKIAASKKKGLWMGGNAPMGYVPHERTLTVDGVHAQRVREIFSLYLKLGSVYKLKAELHRRGWTTVVRQGDRGGKPFDRGGLYRMLANPIYIGQIAHKGVTYPGLHPAIVDAALWQPVQDLLAKNLRGHVTRSNAAEPSLLTGMLFDERGARLQPTHATKGARRYRYYFRSPGANERPLRIPAPDLESAVIDALVAFLRDDAQVMRALGEVNANVVRMHIQSARSCAQGLESAAPSERIEILQRLVARITVGTESLEIALRGDAICVERSSAPSDGTTTIVVPVQLKRCGLAVRLIVRGADEDQARGPNPRLVALLAKAQRWFSALQAGQYPSVLAIAHEQGVATKEVTQVIYLAFMAPDIVQKIARGEQPMDLGVRKLQSMVPLPLEWGEQRRLLGFVR
jgi:site-specific DNA recombinase